MRTEKEIRDDIEALEAFIKGRTGDLTVYYRHHRKLLLELITLREFTKYNCA